MVTDENNHKAESIWASLTPKMEQMVEEGINYFVICSDSTGAQYRNNKNVWLMKEFAMKNKVVIMWLWSEKHHGKGPADGIGGSIKNQVDDLTTFATGHNIQDAEGVARLMQGTYTTIKVSHFTAEDIQNTMDLIPGQLRLFKGATKYHEAFKCSGCSKG